MVLTASLPVSIYFSCTHISLNNTLLTLEIKLPIVTRQYSQSPEDEQTLLFKPSKQQQWLFSETRFTPVFLHMFVPATLLVIVISYLSTTSNITDTIMLTLEKSY